MLKRVLALCLCACLTDISVARSVRLLCPKPSDISAVKQNHNEPWRAYAFSATVFEPLPKLGYSLRFEGQGNDTHMNTFLFATWTDLTFLCWYAGDHGDWVLTNVIDFEALFEHCRFPKIKGSSPNDCADSSVLSCPLECDLKSAGGET